MYILETHHLTRLKGINLSMLLLPLTLKVVDPKVNFALMLSELKYPCLVPSGYK